MVAYKIMLMVRFFAGSGEADEERGDGCCDSPAEVYFEDEAQKHDVIPLSPP
jgi:hypothetical protein